jgi:hypothetical protein
MIVHETPHRLAATAACVAIALAGCGSAGAVSNASSAAVSAGVKHADCMRSHGVPDYGDVGGFLAAGNKVRSPAFLAAAKACAHLLPTSITRPSISAATRTQLLGMAKCMRTHGVPNMPDPTFRNGVVYLGGAGVDKRSPTFEDAASLCRYPLVRHALP